MKKNKLNAIIVDDEKGCITNLQYNLAKNCPLLDVVATSDNLLKLLNDKTLPKIDIAFLDVELFDDNIFNSLQHIDALDFRIVFVTAYEKYAIRAWKVEALDYILKPLAEDDVKDCYSKIIKHFFPHPVHDLPAEHENHTAHQNNKKIILKDNDKVYIIKNEDVYFISGNGFYSTLNFAFGNEERSVIISKPLNKIETEYSKSIFYRVHKSYIVNVTRIIDINRTDGMNIKMKNGKMIPVAKRRINEFLAFLNQHD